VGFLFDPNRQTPFQVAPIDRGNANQVTEENRQLMLVFFSRREQRGNLRDHRNPFSIN
jgi:hypothetical protein